MKESFDVLTGKPSGYTGENAEAEFSKDLVEGAIGLHSQWAQEAAEDDAFRNNVQWKARDKEILAEEQRFPIVINYVRRAIEQIKAALTSQHPRFSSTGREGSDVRMGHLISDVMSYIWYISLGNRELKRVIDDYLVRGKGAMMVYSDPLADGGKGEVYVKSLDPYDVILMPETQDPFGIDSPHIIVRKLYSGEQFVWTYPTKAKLLEKAQQGFISNGRYQSTREGTESQILGAQDSPNGMYEVLDRYSRIKKKSWTVLDHTRHDEEYAYSKQELEAILSRTVVMQMSKQVKQPVFVTDPVALPDAIRLFQTTGGIYHMGQNEDGSQGIVPGPEEGDPMAIPNSETVMSLVQYGELLQTGQLEVLETMTDRIKRVLSVGGVLMHTEILPTSHYPIVTLMYGHNRNPYPQSAVRMVRPIQESINKVRSLIMAYLANAAGLKLGIPHGSADEAKVRKELKKAGVGVFTYNAELGKPEFFGVPPIPGEVLRMEGQLKADIEDLLGAYAYQQGDPSQAPVTYRGTLAIEEYGQRRIKSAQDDVEEFLNQLCRVAVDFMQATYTQHKLIRLVQPNHAQKVIELNQPLYHEFTKEEIGKVNNPTLGRYDIVVVSGSMLPSNRWARLEYYEQLYKDGIIDQVEVLKQTDVADMEGVLERTSAIKQLQSQVAQQEEMIKKLQGDLQTAERESMHDRKRVEVARFQAAMKGVQAKAENATSLYEARLGDIQRMQAKEAAAEGGEVAPPGAEESLDDLLTEE